MLQSQNWKLSIGLLWDAWRSYPKQKRELRLFSSGAFIFITGTHRSGTTWVAKMLAAPGLCYVHEPFNPLKKIWAHPFPYESNNFRNHAIDDVIDRMLRGGFRVTWMMNNTSLPWMPLRMLGSPISRIMIKDPLACLLTEYLSNWFSMLPLVLFRHPAGFVSSVTRLKWPSGSYLGDFLKRDDLIADHLEPYRQLMQSHVNRNDVHSASALYSVLNKVLWNQVQSNPAMRYRRFEDLCRQPLAEFKTIYSEFNLPYTTETAEMHSQLCFNGPSSIEAYHIHAVERNSAAMADSWKKQLSEADANAVRNVWAQFEVPLYSEPEDWRMN